MAIFGDSSIVPFIGLVAELEDGTVLRGPHALDSRGLVAITDHSTIVYLKGFVAEFADDIVFEIILDLINVVVCAIVLRISFMPFLVDFL